MLNFVSKDPKLFKHLLLSKELNKILNSHKREIICDCLERNSFEIYNIIEEYFEDLNELIFFLFDDEEYGLQLYKMLKKFAEYEKDKPKFYSNEKVLKKLDNGLNHKNSTIMIRLLIKLKLLVKNCNS